MSQKVETVTISEFRPEDIPLSCTWIIIGPPGSGKCLAPGTPILMAKGGIKKVEEIAVGDEIMGDDSTPRRVLAVANGVDKMYRILPEEGDPFVVNEPHILCLDRVYPPRFTVNEKGATVSWLYQGEKKRAYFPFSEEKNREEIAEEAFQYICQLQEGRDYTLHNIIEMSVRDYLTLPVKKQKKYHQYRVSVEFPHSTIDLPSLLQKFTEGSLEEWDSIIYNDLATRHQFLHSILRGGSVPIPSPLMERPLCRLLSSMGYRYGRVGDNLLLRGREPLLSFPFRVESVGEGTYHGFELDGNGRFLLGDFTCTHNTSLMENLAYYRKHVYPVAKVFIGTEDGYKKFCKIFHPLFVLNYWDEKEEERHIVRQRTCGMKNGKGYLGNYAINIIDDVTDDPKIFKTKLMKGIFKLGSQHWAQLVMIGTQYAIDMPPEIRKSVSYVAIGREPEEAERKKLFENFGGMAGSYARFCDLMDQITGDYTFLIFKKRSQSNALEECAYFFRTTPLSEWKFGCKEYRKHGEDRYDPKYVEKIVM